MKKARNNLEKARREAGLSITQLVNAAGISRQAYWAYIKLGTTPHVNVALALASVLGKTVEELWVID